MITFYGGASPGGPRHGSARFCDGVSRRSFLRIGGLAMGGLTLPQLLSRVRAGTCEKEWCMGDVVERK